VHSEESLLYPEKIKCDVQASFQVAAGAGGGGRTDALCPCCYATVPRNAAFCIECGEMILLGGSVVRHWSIAQAGEHLCMCKYLYVYIDIYVYIYIFICICIYMYVCICIYIYTYIHICVCVYVYIYMCIYICAALDYCASE